MTIHTNPPDAVSHVEYRGYRWQVDYRTDPAHPGVVFVTVHTGANLDTASEVTVQLAYPYDPEPWPTVEYVISHAIGRLQIIAETATRHDHN